MELFPSRAPGLIFFFAPGKAKHANPEHRDRHESEKELERNPKTAFGHSIKGKPFMCSFSLMSFYYLSNSSVCVLHLSSERKTQEDYSWFPKFSQWTVPVKSSTSQLQVVRGEDSLYAGGVPLNFPQVTWVCGSAEGEGCWGQLTAISSFLEGHNLELNLVGKALLF